MKITEQVETTRGKHLGLTLDTYTGEVEIVTPVSLHTPRVDVRALGYALRQLEAAGAVPCQTPDQ